MPRKYQTNKKLLMKSKKHITIFKKSQFRKHAKMKKNKQTQKSNECNIQKTNKHKTLNDAYAKKTKLQTTSNKCAKWVAATVSLAKSRKLKLAKSLVQLKVFKRT